MKKTKKMLTAALIAALMLPVLNSCKKGENDPFLSLRSRKARVAGEWTVSNWKEDTKSTYSSSSSGFGTSTSNGSMSSLTEFKDEKLSMTSTGNDEFDGNTSTFSSTGSGNGSYTFTFEKDGTFKRKMEVTDLKMTEIYTSSNGSGTTEMTGKMSMEASGTWNFLGGVESDFKNKERIILNILKEETSMSGMDQDGLTLTSTDESTYANGEYTEVWRISMLKNKEMVIDGEVNSSGSSNATYSFSGFSGSNMDSGTEKGTMSGTLSQD